MNPATDSTQIAGTIRAMVDDLNTLILQASTAGFVVKLDLDCVQEAALPEEVPVLGCRLYRRV